MQYWKAGKGLGTTLFWLYYSLPQVSCTCMSGQHIINYIKSLYVERWPVCQVFILVMVKSGWDTLIVCQLCVHVCVLGSPFILCTRVYHPLKEMWTTCTIWDICRLFVHTLNSEIFIIKHTKFMCLYLTVMRYGVVYAWNIRDLQ